MFASTTKQFDRYAGPRLLEQVSREISLPVLAIGGIGPANIHQIAGVGGTRIAVSAALGPEVVDLKQIVDELRAALAQVVSATRW